MVHVLINDGALGNCAHHVRYDKLFNALKFDGASAVGYVLIVIWPHSELSEVVELTLLYTDSVTRDFFNRYLTLRLCS